MFSLLRTRRLHLAIMLMAAGILADSARAQQQATNGARIAQRAGSEPSADSGEWVMAARDYANSRYSALDQINTENAGNLRVAWTFSTGVLRGHEAAPLIVNNTMYVVTPYPNLLHAIDLTKPDRPRKWTYEPRPSPASQGVACCDVVNRGAAYHNGRIYFNTLDDNPGADRPGRQTEKQARSNKQVRPQGW